MSIWKKKKKKARHSRGRIKKRGAALPAWAELGAEGICFGLPRRAKQDAKKQQLACGRAISGGENYGLQISKRPKKKEIERGDHQSIIKRKKRPLRADLKSIR